MRLLVAGYAVSLSIGRRGLGSSSPPQFGHAPCKTPSAQALQNVHSNEQIRASAESGGKSALQHSQLGLSCSIVLPRHCELVRDHPIHVTLRRSVSAAKPRTTPRVGPAYCGQSHPNTAPVAAP